MFLALYMFCTNYKKKKKKKLGETTNRMLNLDLKKKKNRYQNSERESSQIK
jgi:hypothetical protein